MNPQVGQSVQYVSDDDHAENPAAGLITKVHANGRVCLVYWCPDRKGWFESVNVAPMDESDGDTNEPYFTVPGEPDSE